MPEDSSPDSSGTKSPPPSPSAKTFLGGVDFGSPMRRQALVLSLWDGMFAAGMYSLMETFSVAAALHLKTPAIAIALLGSLPLLINSIGQLIIPALINPSKGRKYYVVRGIFVQCMFLLLCTLSGMVPQAWGPAFFILAFIGYSFSGGGFGGLWIGWMQELVPQEVRGRHFAWRNRFFSAVHLACQLSAGLLARSYTAATAPWKFYVVIFICAAAARAISGIFISFQWEPPPAIQRSSLFDFNLSKKFIIFALSSALLQGATAMAGPFFSVWFLRDLHFNYLTLSMASASTVLGAIVFIPVWGKLADRVGNFQVLHLAALMLSIVPLPYLLFSHPLAICLLNFYSGSVWSGFNLGNFNYMLESAGKKKTDRYISVALAATGIMVFGFGMLGGFLATRLPVILGWQLRSLFLLSSLARLTVVAGLFRFIEPAKRHKGITPLDLIFEMPAYRMGMGFLRTTIRTFRRT